ncbi:MAG TPA: SUF system NifU family Fe-S cluster assembly protein [Fimbriimonadales bacterium]|nr:SUF system NifU family Fe-S cluster assembly protein [Fimbriimonadales bacterium]
MTELRELYQEVILDHNKRPRNKGRLQEYTQRSVGHNPLCGDIVTVYLKVNDGVIEEISFEGEGCAISTASASLMTEAVKGKKIREIETLFSKVHEMLTVDGADESLGSLVALAGVREFPIRVKCATLAWHTLQAALRNETTPVSTE